MDAIWQATIDGYMKPIYDVKPEGSLLESVKGFEKKLIETADKNEGSMDIAGILMRSGLQDEYNQLYMAAMNRNHDYQPLSEGDKPKAYDAAKLQRLPTVHEFLDTYRLVYEQIRSNNRETTNKAYEKLFDVENRTDDLIEAQMIIEKEHLILDTLTADYKYIAEDFMEAADPNYEVTSATVKSTIGVYATAKSIDEITYMGEIARGTTDDIAVQTQLKVEMMTLFVSLIYAWELAKRKVREGGTEAPPNAAAMVVTRERMREYYKFMSEDMGLTLEMMAETPFYRIMMLNPSGLDELWRLKKVMHPANIEATIYVLREEILSDKTMEEILMTPQKAPYYDAIDTRKYPDIDDEYNAVAEELNKNFKFFRRNRTEAGSAEGRDISSDNEGAAGGLGLERKRASAKKLIKKMSDLSNTLAAASNKAYDMSRGGIGGGLAGAAASKAGVGIKNIMGAPGAMKGAMGNMSSDMKKEMGKDVAKSMAESAVKDIGRGLLRGFFKK